VENDARHRIKPNCSVLVEHDNSFNSLKCLTTAIKPTIRKHCEKLQKKKMILKSTKINTR
jgi:hypothetical protein